MKLVSSCNPLFATHETGKWIIADGVFDLSGLRHQSIFCERASARGRTLSAASPRLVKLFWSMISGQTKWFGSVIA